MPSVRVAFLKFVCSQGSGLVKMPSVRVVFLKFVCSQGSGLVKMPSVRVTFLKKVCSQGSGLVKMPSVGVGYVTYFGPYFGHDRPKDLTYFDCLRAMSKVGKTKIL